MSTWFVKAFAWFVGLAFGLYFFEWIAIAVLVIWMCNFVEHERAGRSTLLLFVSVVLFYFATGGAAYTWLIHNPLTFLEYAAGYVVLGGVWSLVKWNQLSHRAKEVFDFAMKAFLERRAAELERMVRDAGHQADRQRSGFRDEQPPQNVDEQIAQLKAGKVPDEQLEAWRKAWSSASSISGYGLRSQKPSPLEYKGRIMLWIGYWPWSAVNYLFFNLVRDVIEFVWKRLHRLYVAITEHHFKGVDERLLEK